MRHITGNLPHAGRLGLSSAAVFALKKILSAWLMPLPVVLALLIMVMWLLRRGDKTSLTRARRVLAAAVAVLFVTSLMPVAELALSALESDHHTLQAIDGSVRDQTLPSVAWIVVLGGGHTYRANRPVTDVVGRSSLVRLVEGIRLHRQIPGSRLLLSGGTDQYELTEAEAMGSLAKDLGVPAGAMRLDTESLDTAEQAKRVAEIVGKQPFVLVTSASHMPRALALHRALDLEPIPAATDFASGQSIRLRSLIPRSHSLSATTRAWREALGRIWAALTGAT